VNFLARFYGSSIGKKWIVALTGLVLVGYVIGHLIGNLQIFAGPEKINAYAAFLHSIPGPLWAIRAFLILCFVLHVVTTIKLAVANRAARSQRYAYSASTELKPAKKTMLLGGLVVLSFVIFHLAHFTARVTDQRFHDLPRGEYDVHTMVILGFQNPLVAGFYILAIFFLSMHLSHGFQSVLQTLGVQSEKVRVPVTVGGQALAWLIFVGYVAVPVAVLTGKLQVIP
jgi:succinate dehydrogenase / fumarate reductase cytochrome b subunit